MNTLFLFLVLANAKATDIFIVPQWHLASHVNTKFHQGPLPQSINQNFIYQDLSTRTEKNKIKSVIVEGCEGEITHGFSTIFNGWTLKDLEALPTKDLEPVMTHVGLKLEAKFKDKLKVMCGDNLELIKKNQLAYSDLRGLFGFKMRLTQYKEDPIKKADYIKTVREVLKLPANTKDKDVVQALNAEIKKSLIEFKSLIAKRNESFVVAANKTEKPTAIVIGALHTSDLAAKLKDQNIETIETKGLRGDEQKLIEELERLL